MAQALPRTRWAASGRAIQGETRCSPPAAARARFQQSMIGAASCSARRAGAMPAPPTPVMTVRPPLPACLGATPGQAAKWRPFLKRRGRPCRRHGHGRDRSDAGDSHEPAAQLIAGGDARSCRSGADSSCPRASMMCSEGVTAAIMTAGQPPVSSRARSVADTLRRQCRRRRGPAAGHAHLMEQGTQAAGRLREGAQQQPAGEDEPRSGPGRAQRGGTRCAVPAAARPAGWSGHRCTHPCRPCSGKGWTRRG